MKGWCEGKKIGGDGPYWAFLGLSEPLGIGGMVWGMVWGSFFGGDGPYWAFLGLSGPLGVGGGFG